jgi:hypothetical protein
MSEHETDIPETAATEQVATVDDGWEEPVDELPRRPRRRLFGKGGNPLALALLGVLLLACGFIGGALVEKGQSNSGSSAAGGGSGLAARFAALRSGASAAGSGTTGSAAAEKSAGGLFGGSASAGAGDGTGFTRPTAGTVAYLAGSTLYVTNSEDNTVKVKTSASTTVTRTVTSSVKDIHPGETVTVTGATGAGGAVTAESISAGSSGGGLAALFGGSDASAGSTSGSSKSGAAGTTGGTAGAAGGSGPALFGNGE